MRWAGHIAYMGERRGVYRVLVGKPEGKRLLGRLRQRWEDNIKMDLQELGCGGMDWIDLDQVSDKWQALVSVVMNLRVP
jgi:S-ribosylhomocysteine lyase LuxS involved in autoinducer biosynthesis